MPRPYTGPGPITCAAEQVVRLAGAGAVDPLWVLVHIEATICRLRAAHRRSLETWSPGAPAIAAVDATRASPREEGRR